MKNNFLYLAVRDIKVGELVISKKDKESKLLRDPNYKFPKYGGNVSTSDGKDQCFIYGIGWCKVKNVFELKGLEDFTFDNLMKLWDEYGTNVVYEMFRLTINDCSSQRNIKALQSFRRNGIKDFERASKIRDMTLEMNAILKDRWNIEMKGSPMQFHDTRVAFYHGDEYIMYGNLRSIMLYQYMFGDSSICSLFTVPSISLDSFELNDALIAFCKVLWNRGLLKVDGFSKDADGVIHMPEEFSMKQMFDWIYGDGWGSKVENVFFGDALKSGEIVM